MGERTEIFLVNDNIYFYAHWINLEDLFLILRKALIRGKPRWNDRSYLNRIIFSEMIKDEIDELTGFGISSKSSGDDFITVDIKNKEVNGVDFEEFIK